MNLKMAPSSGGKTQWIKHQKGERLTQRMAIIAKCFDCMGGYMDGRVSCNMPDCPLFPLMPYKNKQSTPVDPSQEAKLTTKDIRRGSRAGKGVSR